MDVKECWLLWFKNFLIKNQLQAMLSLIMRLNKIYNKPKNYANQLLETLKRTVYSEFKDNILGTDLPDTQFISKLNKGFRSLLCVIDIFSKYALVVPLKDKKGVSIVNAFQKTLDKLGRKPNKTWVDKESEFYNNSFKKWLQN